MEKLLDEEQSGQSAAKSKRCHGISRSVGVVGDVTSTVMVFGSVHAVDLNFFLIKIIKLL